MAQLTPSPAKPVASSALSALRPLLADCLRMRNAGTYDADLLSRYGDTLVLLRAPRDSLGRRVSTAGANGGVLAISRRIHALCWQWSAWFGTIRGGATGAHW